NDNFEDRLGRSRLGGRGVARQNVAKSCAESAAGRNDNVGKRDFARVMCINGILRTMIKLGASHAGRLWKRICGSKKLYRLHFDRARPGAVQHERYALE